jgi:ABC-2 type transport system permease protein
LEKLANTLKAWQQSALLQRICFSGTADKVPHPFWVMVHKEVKDHVRSWRFIILLVLILLTCLGSLYTSITNLAKAIKSNDPAGTFFFLKLFTVSDGTLPPFMNLLDF